MMGFKSFSSASKTLAGIGAMNIIKKGQVFSNDKSVQFEIKIVNILFILYCKYLNSVCLQYFYFL
jgi:transposase, IS6 family